MKKEVPEETCLQFSGVAAAHSIVIKSGNTAENINPLTDVIDKGNLNTYAFCGVARNINDSGFLSNGHMVVLRGRYV